MIGTYIIRHPSTGVFYIGSTGNFKQRKIMHSCRLKTGVHSNKKLQESYNLDPVIEWEFTPLPELQVARATEERLIRDNANNDLITNVVFVRGHTQESKDLMSAVKIGGVHTVETKEKMSSARLGASKDPDWVERIATKVRKRVVVDGVEYDSLTSTATAYGISLQLVAYRINSISPKYAGWQKL